MKPSLSSSPLRILFGLILIASFSILTSCDEETDEPDQMEGGNGPTAFDLVFISDNADEVVLSPYLSWTASSDPDGGTITYQVLLDKTGDLTAAGETEPTTILEENIAKNYFALTQALDQATEYSWRVLAINADGESTKSTSVFSFITAANGVSTSPPSDFDLFSPVDGAMDVSLSPLLSWEQSIDPDGGSVFYDVYLYDEQFNPGLISTMNPNLSTTPLSLNYETDYFWEVVAYDNSGAYTLSTSIFIFTTMEEPVQSIMTLVTENSPLQTDGRYGHQNVVHNGELYTLGGFVLDNGDGGDRNDVWKTSDGINWTQVRAHDPFDLNAPHASSESQVVSYQGLLYVFNGERNTIQTSADGAVWEQVAWEGSVSEGTHYPPLQGHQVVVYNGRLLVIGGSSGGQVNNDVWVSDDGGITWAEVSDHNFPARRGHQVVELPEGLYMIGGVSAGQRLNDMWYSIDGINWSEEPENTWIPRTNHQCTAFNDEIYMTGGDIGGDTDEIWVLGESGIWEEFQTDPDYGPRESHHTVVFDDVLYIINGKNSALPVNDIWKIE